MADCSVEVAGRMEFWAVPSERHWQNLRFFLEQEKEGTPSIATATHECPGGTRCRTDEVAEQCQHLLELPGQDGGWCEIAVLKMESHTNQEIAVWLGSDLRPGERKLERIRILQQAEVGS